MTGSPLFKTATKSFLGKLLNKTFQDSGNLEIAHDYSRTGLPVFFFLMSFYMIVCVVEM